MAVKMALFWFCLVLSGIGSDASGQFIVLHSPDSLKFKGSSMTKESLLKEIFSASLGLSVEEDSGWDGLIIIDPFDTPEAAVQVYVDGVSSLGDEASLKYLNFPLEVDEYEPDTYSEVQHRIKQRFSNGGNKLVNIGLSDPSELNSYPELFGDITVPKETIQSLGSLKSDVEVDKKFLAELEALKAITAKVDSGAVVADNIVDYYYFRFRSLHALSDHYGCDSIQTVEAKKLLGEALQDLSKAFKKAYEGSVVVTAVTMNVPHKRAVRAATDTPEPTKQHDYNYNSDYAAIFNIILWFAVVFIFALLAIIYAFMDMDPGRDSVVYRMTSTRVKKDN